MMALASQPLAPGELQLPKEAAAGQKKIPNGGK